MCGTGKQREPEQGMLCAGHLWRGETVQGMPLSHPSYRVRTRLRVPQLPSGCPQWGLHREALAPGAPVCLLTQPKRERLPVAPRP